MFSPNIAYFYRILVRALANRMLMVRGRRLMISFRFKVIFKLENNSILTWADHWINVIYGYQMKWTWHHSMFAIEEVSLYHRFKVVLFQLLIYSQWSNRYAKLECHAPIDWRPVRRTRMPGDGKPPVTSECLSGTVKMVQAFYSIGDWPWRCRPEIYSAFLASYSLWSPCFQGRANSS